MKLSKVVIHKFKCFESDQEFAVEDGISILVGLNESGKTSALEAIAKTNYFEDDPVFKFSTTHDYPRIEKKRMEKSGINPKAVTCTYTLSDELIAEINADLGCEAYSGREISITEKYNGGWTFGGISVDKDKVLSAVGSEVQNLLENASSESDVDEAISKTDDEQVKKQLNDSKRFFSSSWSFDNPISAYVAENWILPNRPKFLYYDEYYALPSRISIEKLQNEQLESEELKTAKALFELAEINVEELVRADDFEDFKAELEATEATISEELFEYWSTNRNLEIRFDIDKVEKTTNPNNTRIVEHVLDIRVRNPRAKVSLPLKNRSKGFNWFFSFLVWFKKIQEDENSQYVLLLDEPGLNLHAAAQRDLLNFLEKLSENYQIVFTTHSPFMVPPDRLGSVRTVLETDSGSQISETLLEKDPNTLFPLQAALGYDLAQNLYISKKNVLVEGISDLVFLEVVSAHLESLGRVSLSADITIVPVGGLEKVATFVSLLRGNSLNVVCMLDSTVGQSASDKLQRLIQDKIIKEKKVLQYSDYLASASEADVEDLFTEDDYLNLFNSAFDEHPDVSSNDLSGFASERMVVRFNKHLGVRRFNHYRPANLLSKTGADQLSEATLNNFEAIFEGINQAMKK